MRVNGKNILVTGGAGFIGSHLVDALSDDNNVIVLDDFSVGSMRNLVHKKNNNKVQVINGDIRDGTLVRRVIENIDVVYHLAAQCLRISISNPELIHEVNVTGTLNICKAALESMVERFVYVSSSEVYGTAKEVPMNELHPLNPTTPYAASKLSGEKYVKSFFHTYDLPAIIVRPFNTYGSRAHFEGPYGEVIPRFVIRCLNNLEPIIFGNGTQTRDFTYVTDTVHGIILASECDELVGDEINIASGRETTIRDLAEIVLKILNKDLSIKYAKQRPGDVWRLFADISKAKRYLGFEPTISLENGMRKYVEWVKEQNVDVSKITEKNW